MNIQILLQLFCITVILLSGPIIIGILSTNKANL